MSAAACGRLTLLHREDCGLCEEFAAQLQQLSATLALPPLELRLVDTDPELQRRYGWKIPVLLWDDTPIAFTRLEPRELERLFRRR